MRAFQGSRSSGGWNPLHCLARGSRACGALRAGASLSRRPLERPARQGQASVALDAATFPAAFVSRPLQLHRRHVRDNPAHSLPLMSGKVLKRGRVWSGPLHIRPWMGQLEREIIGYGVEDNVALYSPSLEWHHTTIAVWSGHNSFVSKRSGQLHLWCGASCSRQV